MCRPYSILLPAGFTMPAALPWPRCALAAPFRPCRAEARRSAFCGTIPWIAPAGHYPAPSLCGARTFLPHLRGGGCPAFWRPDLTRPPGVAARVMRGELPGIRHRLFRRLIRGGSDAGRRPLPPEDRRHHSQTAPAPAESRHRPTPDQPDSWSAAAGQGAAWRAGSKGIAPQDPALRAGAISEWPTIFPRVMP